MPECVRDWCRSCASAIGLRRAHNQRPYRTLPPTQMPSTQTWAMRANRPKPTHFQPADYPMATPLPNPSLPVPLHPLVPLVPNTPRHSCFTSLHNRFRPHGYTAHRPFTSVPSTFPASSASHTPLRPPRLLIPLAATPRVTAKTPQIYDAGAMGQGQHGAHVGAGVKRWLTCEGCGSGSVSARPWLPPHCRARHGTSILPSARARCH